MQEHIGCPENHLGLNFFLTGICGQKSLTVEQEEFSWAREENEGLVLYYSTDQGHLS